MVLVDLLDQREEPLARIARGDRHDVSLRWWYKIEYHLALRSHPVLPFSSCLIPWADQFWLPERDAANPACQSSPSVAETSSRNARWISK